MSALTLWYGGKLDSTPGEGVTFDDVVQSQTGVMLGALSIGQLTTLLPDYAKVFVAARRLFDLLDRVPPLPTPLQLAACSPGQVSFSETEKFSEPDDQRECAGEVVIRDVKFEYPTRPGSAVLRGLSFRVCPNQTIALVGPSGCGKSTVVSLLERFYDPQSGEVTLDGRPLKTLDISWLRSRIGLVSQEPVLFRATIFENIANGKPGATMTDVVAAAKDANAHEFISGFPQGYDTLVTEKGTSLSGGQKQRIAIARALIRNPRILLLDEATSVLESNSESIVQEALDRARRGRTTIVVAHRLSTIATADLIAVINDGTVVEMGTHAELMHLHGQYFCSHERQSLSN
jgi:ABC-type multidrug transport system fused ATPase/permease subunit